MGEEIDHVVLAGLAQVDDVAGPGGTGADAEARIRVVRGLDRLRRRPLLIAVCVAVPLLLARRVREDPVDRALPLLALVLLLRCVLDPLNNVYYHTPFLLALVAAGAFSRTLMPAVVASALIYFSATFGNENPGLLAAMYLAWTLPMIVWLVGRAYGATWSLPHTRVSRVKEIS